MSRSVEEWQDLLDTLFPEGANLFRGQTPEGAAREEGSLIAPRFTVMDVEGDNAVVRTMPAGAYFEDFVFILKSLTETTDGDVAAEIESKYLPSMLMRRPAGPLEDAA
jgi:hypothetical protein